MDCDDDDDALDALDDELLRPEGASYSQISRRATANQLYSVFLVRKKFSGDGLKMLLGGSWTDFGTPKKFSKFL